MKTSVDFTLMGLAKALSDGRTSARLLADMALDAIDQELRDGVPAFIFVDRQSVLKAADESDARRKAGKVLSDFDGITFGVKDLFDVKGQVTTAGSIVLKDAPAATSDAAAVARLTERGMIVLGRTNMTEFAYSGVGINPHYGTPPSVFDKTARRIPGGSSSGSGVAVADGVCAVALGTDTGGSCRIPAAFNGIVGFKPSADRVSKDGVFPLSRRLDSVGPIGRSVSCCTIADAMLSGRFDTGWRPAEIPPLSGLRLGVLNSYVLDGLDAAVSTDFERAIDRLSAQGAVVSDFEFPEVGGLPVLLKNGGILGYEAYQLHRTMLEQRGAQYDPRVGDRIRMAAETDEATFAELLQRRSEMIGEFGALAASFDAVICPTVPMVAPRISELAEDGEYRRLNGLALRNTSIFNFLDGCAISLPMNAHGTSPTGFMLAAPHGQDERLLAVSAAVEAVFEN